MTNEQMKKMVDAMEADIGVVCILRKGFFESETKYLRRKLDELSNNRRLKNLQQLESSKKGEHPQAEKLNSCKPVDHWRT